MKYKRVVTSGCSYAKNSFEENRARKNCLPADNFINPATGEEYRTNFTAELGGLLDLPAYSLAVNGIGFKFIIYHAFLWIKSNLEKVQDTLFIISLSHRGRVTLWRPNEVNTDFYTLPGVDDKLPKTFCVPVNTIYKKDKVDTDWRRQQSTEAGINPDAFDTFLNVFWKELIDIPSKFAIDEMLVTLFNSYCRDIGLDVLYIDVPGEHRHGSTNWRDIINGKFLDFPDGRQYWKDYLTHKDSAYKGEHPNYNDHVELGEILADYIRGMPNI